MSLFFRYRPNIDNFYKYTYAIQWFSYEIIVVLCPILIKLILVITCKRLHKFHEPQQFLIFIRMR